MATIAMKDLLEAGVHFGHQTRRWNPKMKRYIYGSRNGIYIIDLHQSLKLFEDAAKFVQDIVTDGGTILFVGTKKQASDAVMEAAILSRQYFVASRWLGGMLTNFATIQLRIKRLRELEQMENEGIFLKLTKKEAAILTEQKEKLERVLGGIKEMPRLPSCLFVVDTKKEHLAIKEARSLGIPIVAIVDTNCDPDEVDYVIPGNDDAIRAIKLIASKIGEAIVEVKQHEWDEQGLAAPELPSARLMTEEEAALAPKSPEDRRRQMEIDARGIAFDYDEEGRLKEEALKNETLFAETELQGQAADIVAKAEAVQTPLQDDTAFQGTGDVNVGAAEATQIIVKETGQDPGSVSVGSGIAGGSTGGNANPSA